jgi:hypothetical protein
MLLCLELAGLATVVDATGWPDWAAVLAPLAIILDAAGSIWTGLRERGLKVTASGK